MDPSVKPKILPSRKIPLALKDHLKKDLDQLVDKGILVTVTKPTEWVSQMAVVQKSNGKFRICIDPQPLNVALQSEHYNLPTFDDVLPNLKNARMFSKLNVQEAFWHVRLDGKSSILTTMITPYGRYRWTRLSFGLCVSSEIFQRKLNEDQEGLEGTFTIIDDIIIASQGKTNEEALKDNNLKLQKVIERCTERNVIFNSDKMVKGLKEISFHGHTVTNEGIKADPKKVAALLEMTKPTDEADVRRLCGMVQYMARFMPKLSTTLEPIRKLTQKDTQYVWSDEFGRNFQEVKRNLTSAPVLAYFDLEKKLVLQVDSIKDGLGSVLTQDGKHWEISHVRSSPHHPNANGKAKSVVKIMKHLILKCERDGTCQNKVLLEQRNTPRQDTGRSRTEIMFAKKTSTLVASLIWTKENNNTRSRRIKRNRTVKKNHDKKARDLPFLKCGQNVCFEHKVGDSVK